MGWVWEGLCYGQGILLALVSGQQGWELGCFYLSDVMFSIGRVRVIGVGKEGYGKRSVDG